MNGRRFALAGALPALVPHRVPPPRHRPGEAFVKGPIPRAWLLRAMRLPGRSLHVSLELWYRAGLTGSAEVVLSLSSVSEACVIDRATASRALGALESAGLVSVRRQVGRAPRVTLLDWRDERNSESGAGSLSIERVP